MQRLSSYTTARLANAFGNAPGRNQGARPDPRNPITGIYGAGEIEFFTSSFTYTVKPGCTKIRVRAWSPGGGATVSGGTVSFGAYLSITGGAAGNVSSAPGVSTGGDINRSGGARAASGGGGAAGSLIGPGDLGGSGGGWLSGGRSGFTGKGGVPSGDVGSGASAGGSGEVGMSDVLDFIGTGGGGCSSSGSSSAAHGGNGSNGGGGGSSSTTGGPAGKGGFPGGGDGGLGGTGGQGADGGGFGLKEITGLVPGATITVTVPLGGLIIVES